MDAQAAQAFEAARRQMVADIARDPYPFYRKLQAEDPVHWSEVLQAWLITGYDDVTHCFRDSRLSAARMSAFVQHQLHGIDESLAADYLRGMSKMMLMRDEPDHTRLKKHANVGFQSDSLDRLRPALQRTVDLLLDKVQDRGRMDMVRDVSQPLPSMVMADLFKIPTEDRSHFQEWGEKLARFTGVARGEVRQVAIEANDAMLNLEKYLAKILEERRRNRGEDLLSRLIHYEEEGKMNTEELIDNAVLILVAGHVTTIDQLSNTVHCLLSHPDQLGLLRESPELLKSAVEEALRFSPAVPCLFLICREDFEFHGKRLRQGQIVFLCMAAANRDPRAFEHPDRFEIARPDNRHLSFATGAHTCLGAGLARRELEIGVASLLKRMPGLRFDPEATAEPKADSLMFRGWRSLPLLF